jgi:hypothetical protein
MEILQEIGSYAGLAAILGLAVLSVLYFSQARDVKRLREWAGRAPDRAPTPVVPEPRGVVAQPIARPPASRPVPGGTPPPVPRPPGAQPATPAAAAAAGAGPAVAKGPEVEDEKEKESGDEVDVTAMDTVVHPPPTPPEEGEVGGEAPAGEGDGEEAELDDGGETGETGGYAAVATDETAGDSPDDSGEMDALEPGETGEWRPEDEHSGIDFTDEHDAAGFTDEHDAVGPVTPLPRPPVPPRPYERHGAPAPATGYARERGPILPPYAEARRSSESDEGASSGVGRRPILLALAALAAIVVVAFGVTQLIGGEDSGGGDDAGLSADGTPDDGSDDSPGGGGDTPAIDPADVTVAVLNGTTVPGLAATVGDRIQGAGFQLGTVTNNFDQERAESVVLYAPGAEDEAADVGRRLDVSQREPIDAESQALAGDATVVVVAGADQNQ